MEAQFSDTELDDVLSAFADIDDMLLDPQLLQGCDELWSAAGASGGGSSFVSPGPGGVSGAALLAELVAEAAQGEWAALAAGLAPLPGGGGGGQSAEELLAGLDLADVFAPPKPSAAKRIRGHVRRAAELRCALAERVRSIQRLAAENAALRGRSRVLELVVRCRDEQVRLLRHHRPSPDGRVYTTTALLLPEQEQGVAVGPAGAPDWAAAAGGSGDGGGVGVGVGVSSSSNGGGGGGCGEAVLAGPLALAAEELGVLLPGGVGGLTALATMPASGLLDLFRRLVSALSGSLTAVQGQGQGQGQAADDPGAGGRTSARLPERGAAGGFSPEAGAAGGGACGPSMCGPSPLAVVAAGSLAAGGGGSGPRGPMARLRGQMAVFRAVVRYLWLVNDEVCRRAGREAGLVDTMLTGDTAAPEPGHWLRVVVGLGLSGQQLADAAALYACWQEWLGRIHGERRSIAACLDTLLSVNRYGAAYSETVGQYGTDRDTIHKMHANVMREKASGDGGHILSDLQWARAIVASYPYVMDARELVRAAAELHAAGGRFAGLRNVLGLVTSACCAPVEEGL
ncbi:hypothetical protein GPECTOR_10g756 [Gonium pectorale]|uniref:Uncharacterized protein n=1 Tax=Gonium pectorale TaxID=33097 RepID=A0A150GQK9_GONPE|nr:hypothetical protein GPECTOR_10g756 [Gonium pectorale]|eukprot:KXZ52127.1 hypothetical protein GPECTOR_10g756 [Gonium pectorale]